MSGSRRDSFRNHSMRVVTQDDVPYRLSPLPEPVTLIDLPVLSAICGRCEYPARCAADTTCWKDARNSDWSRKVNRFGQRDGNWTTDEIEDALRAYALHHEGIGPKNYDLRDHPELPGRTTILRHYKSLKEACFAAGVSLPKRRRSFAKGQYEDRALDSDPDAA